MRTMSLSEGMSIHRQEGTAMADEKAPEVKQDAPAQEAPKQEAPKQEAPKPAKSSGRGVGLHR